MELGPKMAGATKHARISGEVRRAASDRMANGFVALHMDHGASWIARDYTPLAREGFMRNPVAHRCVRMIEEAASNVLWLLYEGMTEHETHPLLDVITRPQCRLDGTTFFERLHGHWLISGNAYVELPNGRMELHLLRPERVSVETDTDGWPQALMSNAGKRLFPWQRRGGCLAAQVVSSVG